MEKFVLTGSGAAQIPAGLAEGAASSTNRIGTSQPTAKYPATHYEKCVIAKQKIR